MKRYFEALKSCSRTRSRTRIQVREFVDRGERACFIAFPLSSRQLCCKIHIFKTISDSALLYLRMFKSLHGLSQVPNFQQFFFSVFSPRKNVLLIFFRVGTPLTSMCQGSADEMTAKAPSGQLSTLQDDAIKNLIKMKFCLCCSDCKIKQRQPLCSWSPLAPDHEPIPHCPTGLSEENKKQLLPLLSV